MNSRWRLALLGLFVVSALLHFTALDFPHSVIFDEVHFGKFVTAYCCTHQRFFDIHPPVTKLLIAASAYMGGYKGDFDFDHIGEAYYPGMAVVALRFVQALAGTLFPLLIYMFLRQLGASRRGALFGGVLMVLDNALLLQTRMIVMDGVLLLTQFGALSLFLWARHQAGTKRYVSMVGVGALAGMAVGTKFTGLAILIVLGGLIVWPLLRLKKTKELIGRAGVDIVLIGAAAAAVYFGAWYVHFSLLTLPGSGDAWGVPTGSFWPDVMKLQQTMLNANYNLTAGHPYASPWWSWPLMFRPIFYWTENNAYLYFIGNPAVWWGVFLGFLAAVVYMVTTWWGRQRNLLGESGWLLLFGYGVAYAPLMRVPRALFLYHYLTPLIFSLLLAVLWLDKVWLGNKHEHYKMKWYGVAGLIVLAMFVFFSPYTYGFPISEAWHNALFWLPGWR